MNLPLADTQLISGDKSSELQAHLNSCFMALPPMSLGDLMKSLLKWQAELVQVLLKYSLLWTRGKAEGLVYGWERLVIWTLGLLCAESRPGPWTPWSAGLWRLGCGNFHSHTSNDPGCFSTICISHILPWCLFCCMLDLEVKLYRYNLSPLLSYIFKLQPLAFLLYFSWVKFMEIPCCQGTRNLLSSILANII